MPFTARKEFIFIMKRKIIIMNIIIIFIISFSKVNATSIPVWSSMKISSKSNSLNIIDDDSLNPNAIAQTSGKIVTVENNPLNLTCFNRTKLWYSTI